MSLRDIYFLSLVCFALSHQTLSVSIQQLFFCPRIDLYGRVYQAAEAPYSEKLDVTKIECALDCMTSNCNSFNYNQSSNECSIFIGTPANLALANDSKINYEVCLTLEILPKYYVHILIIIVETRGGHFDAHWREVFDNISRTNEISIFLFREHF